MKCIIIWQMGRRAQPLTERKFALNCALGLLLLLSAPERNFKLNLRSVALSYAQLRSIALILRSVALILRSFYAQSATERKFTEFVN